MRRGMMGSLSGSLASLGAATPYAMAAKMAFPDRVVIAFIGDGAMQMNGLNVMITISKYWKEWSDPRLIVMVLNNRDLNQVTWEERMQLGVGKTESTQSIPDFPYHKYAELLGLKGIFVDDPEKLGAAWDEALAADRPVILECYTDPNVPPLPPHITLKDAKNFMTMTTQRTGTWQRAEEQRQAAAGQCACRAARTERCARIRRSSECGRKPTPSLPTFPRPTGRHPGRRRRSSSCMPKLAGCAASATPTRTPRSRRWSATSWRRCVTGLDVMDPPAAWRAMQVAVRNLGREGLAATAISAVDTALWDLKAVPTRPTARLFTRPLPRSSPDLRQRWLHELRR